MTIDTPFLRNTMEIGNLSDATLSRLGPGVIAIEGVEIPTVLSPNSLENKRIVKRLVSAASYTSNTGTSLNSDNCDLFIVTAQAGPLLFNDPGGAPVEGQDLLIRIKDNATAQTLTYGGQFRASSDLALPTTTIISRTLLMKFIRNQTDSRWDLVAFLNNFT